MTSRRQRTRGDKRERFTSEPSPELESVLSAISTGRCEEGGTACTDCESQGRCMVETKSNLRGGVADVSQMTPGATALYLVALVLSQPEQ